MDYITTTDLRTQSSQLVKTLKSGGKVSLVHRSQVIGVITPKKQPHVFTKKDIDHLNQLAERSNVPGLSYEERDKLYRQHLEEKYGKGVS